MSSSSDTGIIDLDDLAPAAIEVTGVVDGRKRKFTLREADAESARIYNNHRINATKFRGDPTNGTFSVDRVEGASDMETLLVSRCLYEGDRLVPLAEIRGWRNAAVVRLFNQIKAMSDLGDGQAEEKAKNGRSGSAATSSPQAS